MVWKFEDLSVTQILREINIEKTLEVPKKQVCHFKGSEFC